MMNFNAIWLSAVDSAMLFHCPMALCASCLSCFSISLWGDFEVSFAYFKFSKQHRLNYVRVLVLMNFFAGFVFQIYSGQEGP